MLQVIKAEDVRDGEPRWWCPDDVYAARTLEWIVTSNLHTEWRGAADAFTLAIVERPAPTPTPAPGLDLDAVADTMRGLDNIFAQAMSSRDAEIARLTAELAAARAEVDCGQDGPCAKAPGCARHWQERNRELVAELAAAGAVTADVCRYLDCSASDLLAVVTSLYESRARAISDATAARGTVGGLLATAPVGSIVECDDGGYWTQHRVVVDSSGLAQSESRDWQYRPAQWQSWRVGTSVKFHLRLPARLVPAAEADADPSQRGPLPKGG